MTSSPLVDSILALLAANPSEDCVVTWIRSNGGLGVLDTKDGFGMSVGSILREWGLGHVIGAITTMVHLTPELQRHEGDPCLSSPTPTENGEAVGQCVAANSALPASDQKCESVALQPAASGVSYPAVYTTPPLPALESTGALDATVGTKPEIGQAAGAAADAHAPVTPGVLLGSAIKRQSPGGTRPATHRQLCALSDALARRLEPIPCARCFLPECLAALDQCSPGGSGAISESISEERRAETVVTSVAGTVGWWVQHVELRKSTTAWQPGPPLGVNLGVSLGRASKNGAATTSPGSSSLRSCGETFAPWVGSGEGVRKGRPLPLLAQTLARTWHGDDKFCAASADARAGARCEAIFELLPGEAIVKVEQFIVPRGDENRTQVRPWVRPWVRQR